MFLELITNRRIMKLKYLSILLLLFFIFMIPVSCQSNKTERLFNETFGLENSQTLNLIIDKTETILENIYNVKGFESAANKFLLDLVNTDGKIFKNKINKEELKAIDSLFSQDSLKYKIWDITNINGKERFNFKLEGIYLSAFKRLKEKEQIAYKYYEVYLTSGSPPYILMIESLLNEEQGDLSHFLMKRIIVVDIFYIYALSLIDR